ncbi:hypothetical protein D1614_22490 [Maribellus luteus]|uniref:Uncharacterized protein n=1 Tax=Maribellus luteus TaxID=2305463 RepID=A0A399SPC5_9BACT|nr:hypothetical protein [Maribellus luteus]RIJ45550.1 hypothetical protein D1614_22490 [Maribellus luteus]
MSIERDYLMRQLMQLFEVIHKILGHRERGEDKQAEDQIRYFYNCLKIDADIQKMSIGDLLAFLQNEKKLSNEHLELFAFVLKEQGEMAVDEKDRINFFQKAYFLLDKVERESTVFSMERQLKLGELKTYLN